VFGYLEDMTSNTTHLQILNQFKGDKDLSTQIHFEHMDLTPSLVLAAALMYMMTADGVIKDSESSQLQSVLGGNDELLACAASYVQSVPLDTFLKEAADSLSSLDKLCILTNVCDSFLADGQADDSELILFSRICEAFGFDEAAFDSHLKTIQIKNNKSVLGRYNLAAAMHPQGKGPFSNHLAMAACIVYMMAADGNIGTEEIGRLQAAIGEYDGLQSVALKYVVKVKSGQFLKDIAPTLNADVKLMILTNVCDTLLSDGVVDAAEKKLFMGMLTAFGYSEKTFRSFYETLHLKNVKSFDLADFADSSAAQVFRSTQYQASQAAFNAAHAGEGEQIGSVIHRTLEENIASVTQNAGGEDNVHTMTDNANNRQNIQKVSAGSTALEDNIQFVNSQKHQKENIQFVDGQQHLDQNIQYVDSSLNLNTNIQRLNDSDQSEFASTSREWGIGHNPQDLMSQSERMGLESEFQSGANSDMTVNELEGKGGLTTMARGEISFRERAMQKNRLQSGLAGSKGKENVVSLHERLLALKQRNAEVDQQLQQLHASSVDMNLAVKISSDNAPVETPNNVATAGGVSVLQRWSQVIAQGLPMNTPSRQLEGAALT
jgi:uncharacterized tellurite resistance protein B-like protein